MSVNTHEEIISLLQANRLTLKKFGVKSLALFGSAARNRIGIHSDIDFLVQFEHPTWKNYIGLKFFLQELLQREVDLATPKALKPAIRSYIEKDLLYAFS